MASPLAEAMLRGAPDDERSGYPDWLLQAAMHVPDSPEMTRALPGYESRDPAELAMLRHQGMVRPTAGRQDFPMEHLANMASAGLGFTPVGMALAPEMLAGRALAAGAQYAPRLTAAALGAGGAMAPSMTEGAENQHAALPKDPKDIMALQAQLKAAGYPIEKIDGVINPGGPTERAFRQFQQDQATRRAEDLKREELRIQGGKTEADTKTAEATTRTAEAKLKETELEEKRLERKRLADERIRELDKELPLSSKIMRDYSGPAGMVLGGVAGSLGRVLTQVPANRAIRETAKAGNKIMAEDVTAGKKGAEAALARATRANEFWRAGGAKEVPFLLESGKPGGFAINPKTTPINSTYSPQIHPAVEAAAAAPAALEFGWSNHYKGEWEQELKDAQKALSEDASEANIQRVNKAKDNVGLFTGLERLGQTALGVQAVGAIGNRFLPKGPAMRPNMQPAEQEQGSLQEVIRKAVAAAEKKAADAARKNAPRAAAPQVGIPPAMTGPAATKARTPHSL